MKPFRFLALLAFFSVSAVFLRAEPIATRPMPAWKLKDVDGKEISSDQFKGKVLVIDFWATWCGPCKTEIPGYGKLQEKYGKDVVILGFSVDRAGPAVVKKFIEKNKMGYQVVMSEDDVANLIAGDEGISAIPTTFIVDRAGNIRERKIGAEPTEVFEKSLVKYLQ